MASISTIATMFQRLESRHLAIRQDRCVRVRNRHASCRRCSEACTSHCIGFKEGEIVVLSENCIGCGTCATVCPTCAIEARAPGDGELLSRAKRALAHTGSTVAFTTARIAERAGRGLDTDGVVTVGNLGRIDETLLVGLARAGARSIALVHDDPKDDAEAKGLETACLVCETASTLFDAWGVSCTVDLTTAFPAEVRLAGDAGYDAGRREFLTATMRGARDALLAAGDYVEEKVAGSCEDGDDQPAASGPMRVMQDGTLPHFVPDRREYMLDALYEMGEPCAGFVSTRLWGHAVIDERACTGCRMCATFCPTGALAKFEEDGRVGICHAPSLCVKCLCCEDVCTRGAITVCDEVEACDLLSGRVDFYDMGPDPTAKPNPHAVRDAMRSILGTQAVSD